jgi:glycosyltransferase involved in cell wall biosynthesis
MNKIKLLVISNDMEGVGLYRLNAPYLSMDDPDIEIIFHSMNDFTFRFDEETLKDFNVIVYHKGIPFRVQSDADNFPLIIKKYNIKLIYDIDDHWQLSPSHPNYAIWKKNNSMAATLEHIKNADYITTTTPFFAKDIMEYNKNVLIAENAVNTKEYQWIPKKIKSEKKRFIWGGGITHKVDLMLLKDSFKLFSNDFLSKSQVYMCGFDLRMKTDDGIYVDDPKRNTWSHFETIFTNNGKWITNPEYKAFLNTYSDIGRLNYGYNEKFKDEFYQRRWTKPIFTYGTMYNSADVALAPLKNNMLFNLVKSNLKIIEAGVHKCPVIASNYGPYTIDVIDGKHGFLINENEPNKWYEKMKFFVDNPNAIIDMGNALNELVLEKYTLEKVNQKRIDLIKSIAFK